MGASEHPGVSLYRRSNGVVYARFNDPSTGKDTRLSLAQYGFTSKQDALPWARAKSREIERVRRARALGELGVESGQSALQVLESYRLARIAELGDARAKKLWLWHLKPFREFLTAFGTLSELRLRDLDYWRLGMTVAPSTRNRYMGAAAAFLRWALDRHYTRLTDREVRIGLKPFKTERVLPRVLSPEECQRLIDTARRLDGETLNVHGDMKFRPVLPHVLLGLLTGMRPGEIDSLTWECVDLPRSEIRVMGAKTGVERSVPLHDSPALVSLLGQLSGDPGKSVVGSLRRQSWVRTVEAAGLPGLRRNELRKTCISAVASRSTYSEFLLGARFGHGQDVSIAHYRRAIHGPYDGPATVEGWLGVKL